MIQLFIQACEAQQRGGVPLESFNDVYGLEMLLEDYEHEISVQPH